MNTCDEKTLLLQGIQALAKQMEHKEITIDLFNRYSTLVSCLVDLNWKECGNREGEGRSKPA